MTEKLSADSFRKMLRKQGKKPRKAPSAEERAAEKVDNAIHSAAKVALKSAGFDPADGYVLQRALLEESIYVVVPSQRREP